MTHDKTKDTAQKVMGGQVLDQALDGKKRVKGHDLHLDLTWSRTCPHVLPSGKRNHGRCHRWKNNSPALTLIILFFSWNIISSIDGHGNMHQLHWESEAAVIHVLNRTNATFPWIHSSSSYVGITWYYIGTPETPRRDILQIYTEYKINAYGPKQDRLGFQNQTGSAILTLKDVTVADEGDYQAQVIRSLYGSHDQVENIKSITRLKIIFIKDLNYTLSLNGTKNSSYNFSVNPAEIHIDLPPWGSTVTVPNRFNMTVNVSQAGAPRPTIRIWKVVNSKNHSQPICDSFYCNRYVTLTSDDAREANECMVVIEIDFRIQNLKPLIHTFGVSIETASEGTSTDPPVTDPGVFKAVSWRHGVIIGVTTLVTLINMFIVGLVVYKLVPKKRKRTIQSIPWEEEWQEMGILLRSESQHPVTDTENIGHTLSIDEINSFFTIHPSFAEYSLDVPIDSKEENNDKFVSCLIIITALLNTSGGVLTLNSNMDQAHADVEEWQKQIHEYTLTKFGQRLRPFLVIDTVKRKMQIRVKKGPHLVTFNYDMVTWNTVALEPTPVTDFEEVLGIVQCGKGPRVKGHVADDSDHLQHKPVYYMNIHDFSESSLNSKWRKLELVIQSFANSGGGIINIKANRTSKEFSLTNISERIPSDVGKRLIQNLRRWTHEKISEMVHKSVIWRNEMYIPAERIDWDLRVLNNEVLRIFVYKCPGGVFRKCPECYVIDDLGRIRALSFTEWRNRMLDVDNSNEHTDQKMSVLEDLDQPSGSGIPWLT